MGRKARAAIVAAALAVGGLLAGALSAQALGEVGVPGVTVTVPTVSLPIPTTPPAPAPVPPVPPPPPTPAVTLATPPAPVPGPDSPSPPPPSSPSPPPPSPPSPSSPPPDGGAGSTGGPAGRYFPASHPADRRRRPPSASRRARVTGMRARPGRLPTRRERRTAVRISFTLTGPTRVVFVVRGPAPSCGVAGRFSVRGHRGVNRVRFTGRVGRRELPSGTYRISASTSGRPANRSVVVVLGDHAPPTRFQCRSRSPQTSPFVSMLAAFTPGTGPPRAAPNPRLATKKPAPAGAEPDSGVLPAVTDRLRELPESVSKPQLPNAASPPWILAAATLLLLVVSSLALLVYVVRFLRGPHAT